MKSVITILILTLSILQLKANVLINKRVTLKQAIDIALKNSEKNKISQHDLNIAKAQYKQAMSANYPSIDLDIMAVKRDEKIISKTKDTISIPALALLGLSPTIPLDFENPIMGDKTISTTLQIAYPIYTGGKIAAIQKQAKLGEDIAGEKDKRTKQEIIFDIKKYYYGVQLAKKITAVLRDTLSRMEALNDLTKKLYESGSDNVNKTDYYKTTIATQNIKTYLTELSSNVKLAKSALIFAMGIDPKSKIRVNNSKKLKKLSHKLDFYIENAYQNNTQLIALHKATKVYDAKLDEAKSAFKPNITLFGTLNNIDDNYEGGLSNNQNNKSWSVGLSAKWNLFNGHKSTNELNEVKVNKLKIIEQERMLKNSLALQVKKAYLETSKSRKNIKILKKALKTAKANRKLNAKAYQADMVKAKDVVEAQISEAQIEAKYYQVLHSKAISYANLDLITGKEK